MAMKSYKNHQTQPGRCDQERQSNPDCRGVRFFLAMVVSASNDQTLARRFQSLAPLVGRQETKEDAALY
jgi:hypothetical protein